MNNCHRELTWLVSSRLKQIRSPIIRAMIFGPYLSKAQPPRKANKLPSTIFTDKTEEVKVRVKLNSLSIDVKNTPKEKRIPKTVVAITRKVTTTIQP